MNMFKRRVYQVLTAAACSLGSTCLGMLFVWPSYTLPMLASANSTILSARLSETEEAMLGSLPSLGAAVGSALVGVLMEAYGRKTGSLLMTLLFMLSWCMIGTTRSIIVVLVARFLGGVAGGATMVINPVFVAEVSEDSIRGTLATGMVTFFGFGSLFSYFIGWYCSYHAIAWINLAVAIFRSVLLMSVPESPVFFVKNNKIEDARKSIAIYRGAPANSTIVQEELSKIREQISLPLPLKSINENGDKQEMTKLTSEEIKEQPRPKFLALKTLCKSPASRRAFIILVVAFAMETMMGLAPVQVYAKQVFIQADPTKSDLYSVILAVCWCCGAVVCSAVTDKLGRRVMLISSACAVGICLLILGILLQTKIAPPWVTVIFIMLFCFCFQCGSGTVPYILLCEMFCPEVQTLASMLIVEWMWITAFVVLALFNWLSKLMGIHVIFYIFTINSFLYATFSYFLVPETKGLSNKQIQLALLTGRRKKTPYWEDIVKGYSYVQQCPPYD